MKYDIVVIGGGAGGFTACLEAKRLYPGKSVLMIRRDEHTLIPCAIPYIAGALGGDLNKNILPDKPLKDSGVEILVDEVVKIDRDSKVVETKGGKTIGYDRLILALGSTPVIPKPLQTDLENVFVMNKSYNYVKKLVETIRESDNIVVVGGGVAGVEFTDDMIRLGKNVSIVEILPNILLLNFDEEFASIAADKLKEAGVKLYTNTSVTGYIGESGRVKGVKLSNGSVLDADMVLITIGVKPNSRLAAEAGLKIAENGAIEVDEYMRTSDPNIYAVGDCALKRDIFTGSPAPYLLASVAAYEARVAVENLYGVKSVKPFKGIIPVLLTTIRGLCFGAAGLTESTAKKYGIEYVKESHETVDIHPGTLTTPNKIIMKMLFSSKNYRLLGVQAVGGKSISELVNLLAFAISRGVNIYDLHMLPYGTQPYLTASPIAYPVPNIASKILKRVFSSS